MEGSSEVRSWLLDGSLVRTALVAEEYFDARIAEAREYERQRLDSY
jgi:hypothetical protein